MGIRRTLVVAALVGFGAFTWGCNDDGGGSLSVEEYFERIDELDEEQQAKSDELEQKFDDLGEDASVDEVDDLFEEQIQILRDFVSDLDDINPPDEASEPHEQAVRAFNDVTSQFDDLLDGFREAETVEEAFASVGDSEIAEFEDATAACLELEEIAADNNIEIDLDCEDEE